MIETPGLMRSDQSRIPLGFPLRTRNTMVDVYGELFCASRFCQSVAISPLLAIASTSPAKANVTTSASSPSITARAWEPEPPWACLNETDSPALAFQYLIKAGLNSL